MNNEPSNQPPSQHHKTPEHPASAQGYGYDGFGYGGYPVYVAGDGGADSFSPLKVQRFVRFLRTYWWVPLLTTAALVAAALLYNSWTPPTYTSIARVWETEKLRLPDGAAFTGDATTYYGTQVELLRSIRMQEMALARLQAS